MAYNMMLSIPSLLKRRENGRSSFIDEGSNKNKVFHRHCSMLTYATEYNSIVTHIFHYLKVPTGGLV